MREIKFRAWNGHNMFNNIQVGAMYLGDLIADPQWYLMQYTNLKDKNGREIYESDILKVTGEYGESYVATVKWFGDEDYPAFDLAGIPAPWSYDANALATIFQSGVETCEVIGNIFEDQNLLEAQHE
ncbi:YopX family protein [Schleiferilactobacillus harbinensis]|uniref:YopX family protein n=1 Tax=Schleiferilactobacillus harbinensis TaxID=304207 RepID=UPI0039EC3CC3